MSGLSLTSRETAALREIVALCARPSPDEPLPWPVVEAMALLFRASTVALIVFRLGSGDFWFAQSLAEHGPELDASGPLLQAFPFYWRMTCGVPERLEDFDTVWTSERLHAAGVLRGESSYAGMLLDPAQSSVLACACVDATHQLRLLMWRQGPFAEHDAFLIELLRPHLVLATHAYRRAHPPPTMLTPRQLAVMHRVRDGLTNLQIARCLDISEGTVRTHLNQIYRRLGVASRTEAVRVTFDPDPARRRSRR